LVANSNTAFLWFSISISSLHQSGMFIAGNLFGGSIFLWHIKFISGQLETLWGSPLSSIVTIDTGKDSAVCGSPCVGFSVKLVLNLMNVSIPGHLDISFIFKVK
jgi:hypothetical protein